MTIGRPLVVATLALVTAGIAGVAFRAGGRRAEPPKSGPTRFAKAAPRLTGELVEPPLAIPAKLALKQVVTENQSAFIPPQCYTKTIDDSGKVHNPCYTCHVASRAPNFINDPDIQLAYAFVPRARKNAWKNLLTDWTARLSSIRDDEILAYARKSNYFDETGAIILARRLAPPPEEWDHKSDGTWSGFVPDARFRFDERGFDRLEDGGYTGWRAFAYYPLPGTFWPTNGSIGDVMIRLPAEFRQDVAGAFSRVVYEANLAVVEAVVTRKDVPIDPTDEALAGCDLDQNGTVGRATRVVYRAPDDKPSTLCYAGDARAALTAGKVHLGDGLYPEGTEFLHSVRYLDPTPEGIRMAARLKELRYAKKTEWFTVAQLDKRARAEATSKVDSPSELRNFGGDIERGVSNNQGWFFQGFIEDKQGDLRPQTFEENVYCTGCHGGVGVTDDGIFSYSRRLGRSTFQAGFYHWSQRGLEGVADRPIHGGSSTEYVTYLEVNGAGDEFRQNEEVRARFFDEQGKLIPSMKKKLREDVSVVLLPSPERALALDKAYRLLVLEQSFRLGREVVLSGARKVVHRSVEAEQKTGVVTAVEPPWGTARLAAAEVN